MTDKTVSTFRGFGHKVHIVKRPEVSRQWALMDNRRVLVSSSDEFTIKRAFIQHVQSLTLQTSIEL